MRISAHAVMIAFLASSPAFAAPAMSESMACAKASGMANASVSAPVRFSGEIGKNAMILSGIALKGARKGRSTTMLCLYDPRTGRAETQDAGAWSKAPGR